MLKHYLGARREGAAAAQVLHLHQPVRHQLHAAGADGGHRALRPCARPRADGAAAGPDALRRAGRHVRAALHVVEQRRLQAARHATRGICPASSACRSTSRRTDGALVHQRQEDRLVAQADRRRVLAHPRLHLPRRRPVRDARTSPRRASSRSSTRRRASASSTGSRRSGRRSRPTASGSGWSASSRTCPSCAWRPSRRSGCPTRRPRPTPTRPRSWATGTPWRWPATRRRWRRSTRSSTRGCCAPSCPIRRTTRRSSRRSRQVRGASRA